MADEDERPLECPLELWQISLDQHSLLNTGGEHAGGVELHCAWEAFSEELEWL